MFQQIFYFCSPDVSCESRLLGQISAHPQTTGLSHSHSCMELCTQEDENLTVGSLYEREKIPLAPGIVLRTKQEIEGRQRYVSQANFLSM